MLTSDLPFVNRSSLIIYVVFFLLICLLCTFCTELIFFQFDYFTINFLTVYIVPSILWVIAAVFLGRVCASVDTASLSVFVKTLSRWLMYLTVMIKLVNSSCFKRK